MSRILEAGRNAWALEPIEHAGVLIDACDYYRAFYQAMSGAKHYALLAGWQFDSDVRLLRGPDAAGAPWPVELLPFMEALCRERPELRIYVLAWDYSVVYTFEREWMQRLKFDFGTSDHIRYVLDGEHPVGASHHQKLVVVDGRIAFVGGADLCDGRWDDRSHSSVNVERVNRYGDPYKPYHEVIAYVTGAKAIARLEETFRDRFQRASGEPLVLPVPDAGDPPSPPVFEGALPLDADVTAIARTYPARDTDASEAAVKEIRHLYEDAIGSAERLIYIETQYITSHAIHDALVARLRDDTKPKLVLVLVVPHGSDTLKEELVLGAAESRLLASVERVAKETGHALRVLFSAPSDASPRSPPTFVHSKLLVVDDSFLTIGSANCTNRSFSIDSELNLAWECDSRRAGLRKDIARLRASLLSEHAGIDHDVRFEDIDGLVPLIDELLAAGSRLRARQMPDDAEPLTVMQLAFDPEGPLLQSALDEFLGQRRVTVDEGVEVDSTPDA
ncbi:MAG TPA: phospholipase D-like domain-containing protein [Polyangiaceae bacterium]|jgi:phosphatidylserine/phosphatidylglycerophosphate/cardiolipin synthase-like enzyme|nr:phospholipase D-like domain-containing protein [Polyangiaceae bacterium]